MSSKKNLTTHDADEDERNASIMIYINGQLVPKEDAKISVYDSGFLLGDGMWEGMRLYDGKWAFFNDHMDRLLGSLKAVSIDLGMSREDILEALTKTRLANNMHEDAHCRLMITRGRKKKPFQHPSLSVFGPTIVIIMEHSKPRIELLDKGIRLATVPQIRGMPMAQDAKYNSHSKLNCVLACLQAEQAGADEGLMLDPHGFVNTTNACNFFIVKKGTVLTSTGDYCMNGVTRQKVIDLCRANAIPVFEKNFSLVDVNMADEAFLTGTFGSLSKVSHIDGKQIGPVTGSGPITNKLRELYKNLVAADIA
ncbi:MAG: aminotransferase class IV [Salaquimonas sp.]